MSTRKSSALRVVPKDAPDLSALDGMLTDFAEQLAPMVTRSGSLRAKMDAELKVLVADQDALHARRQLIERHYQALMTAFDREDADIMRAISACQNALRDSAEQTERTET